VNLNQLIIKAERRNSWKNVTIGTNERRRLERLVWKCARLQVNFKVDWTMVSACCTVCVCVCAGFLVRQRTRSRRLYRRRGEMCLIQTKETCAITLEKSAELKHPDPLVHLIDLTPPTTDNLPKRRQRRNALLFLDSLPTLSLSHSFSPSYSQVEFGHTQVNVCTTEEEVVLGCYTRRHDKLVADWL
jgi:hypothetical protein